MPSSPPGGTCGIYLVEKRPVQYWNELRSNNAFLGPLLNEQWNFFMFALWWPGSWTLPFSCFDRTLAEYFIRWAGISASVPLSRPLFKVCLNICIFPKKNIEPTSPPGGTWFLKKKSREWRKPRDQVNDIHFERMRLVCRLTQLSGRWKWNVTKRLSPLATTSSLSHVFPSEMNTSDFKNFHSTMI